MTLLSSLKFTSELRRFAVRILGAMLLLGYAIMFAGVWPRVGLDWREYFYPYSMALLHGQNPFSLQHGIFVPWALIFCMPFALLPPRIGVAVFFVFTAASYAFIAHRLGAKELALVAFLSSPAVSTGLLILNVDVFVLWGFVLPPPIAVLLLLIKPQIGGVLALLLLREAWLSGGWRKLGLTMAPTAVVCGLSFLVFGNWLAHQYSAASIATGQYWNTSLFPLSLVAGVPLAVLGLWKGRKRAAMAAAALCSPYLTLPSWSAVLLAGITNEAVTVALVVVIMILRVTVWRGL